MIGHDTTNHSKGTKPESSASGRSGLQGDAGTYDQGAAARYWGEERLHGIEAADHAAEDAAVLCQGKPRAISEAYAGWERRCLETMLPDLSGRSLLDLGCGVGRLLPGLARRAEQVTGVDVAPGMLARAARRVEGIANVELRRGSVSAIPADDGSFGVVVCVGVFEHVPAEHRRRALAEITRVLRPGGELLLELNNAHSVLLHDATGDNPHRLGNQLDNGYFCELVTADDILAEGTELREVERTANAFFSAVRHSAGEERSDLDELFAQAAQLDAALGCSPAARRLADQFMIRLVRA